MKYLLSSLFVLLCLLVMEPSQAIMQYSLTRLDSLGGSYAAGYDVNENGWVVGRSYTPSNTYRACLWHDATLVDLGAVFGDKSEVCAINDDNLVAGHANWRAFYYNASSSSGAFIGTLGGATSFAYGVNNQGQIVGASDDANDVSQGFIYENGVLTQLPVDTPNGFLPYDVNEFGIMVGLTNDGHGHSRAGRWEDGDIQSLGTLGGTWSSAAALNDLGQIVGTADTPWRNAAFLYENGTMLDLGPEMMDSYAHDINNHGVVVGSLRTGSGFRAFVWENGHMLDLNLLVEESYDWMLKEAFGINDQGQIVGTAVTPDGTSRAFLLTPTVQIPEPSLVVLLGAGLLVVARKARMSRNNPARQGITRSRRS